MKGGEVGQIDPPPPPPQEKLPSKSPALLGLSIFFQRFCFYSLGFPSLYINKNIRDFLRNKNQVISSNLQ